MLVTERIGHARDTLLSADLSDFHASFILCFVLRAFAASFIFLDKFLDKFLLYRLLPIFAILAALHVFSSSPIFHTDKYIRDPEISLQSAEHQKPVN